MTDGTNRPVAVLCGAIEGVDAVPVLVEATMRGETGVPRILGSVDQVVREAYHRVLTAYASQDLPSPRGSPLINFVPAGLRKSGSGFDLPMALALAGAGGTVDPAALVGVAALGELALDGRVLPARGAVAIALAARRCGARFLLAHPHDAALAAVVPGIAAVPVVDLRSAFGWIFAPPDQRPPPLELIDARDLLGAALVDRDLDFADIRGHETPKTALLVAAAGRHDALLVGPPGSGKSAMLKRLPGLLPTPSDRECLDVLRIHSTFHDARTTGGLGMRPFRAPHHTSSCAAILGGGAEIRPGEVTLAHHGLLFLDELPEFRREVLEGLRQPLEDRSITVARVRQVVTMPADFLLVAAMNPCPCGYAGSTLVTCRCSQAMRSRYRDRVSGPLRDRFDLQIEVPALPPDELSRPRDLAWSSARMRERIDLAVERQQRRNPNGLANGRLDGPPLERVVVVDHDVELALSRAMKAFRLSGRGRVRVLRVARTLADLDDHDSVTAEHVLRAARLRCG